MLKVPQVMAHLQAGIAISVQLSLPYLTEGLEGKAALPQLKPPTTPSKQSHLTCSCKAEHVGKGPLGSSASESALQSLKTIRVAGL